MNTPRNDELNIKVTKILSDLDDEGRTLTQNELLLLMKAEKEFEQLADPEKSNDSLGLLTAEEQLGRVRNALKDTLDNSEAKAA